MASGPISLDSDPPLRTGKPLQIIVGYPPGGSTDTFARLLSQPLQGALGRSVVDSGIPNFIKFVEQARAKPGKLSISVAGGTAQEVMAKWLTDKLKIGS